MRRMQRREDEQDTLAHKYNVMMSDMLLEAADSTTSAKSKGKGMSRSDRVALFEEQKQLAKEARVSETKTTHYVCFARFRPRII